ncbi:unnamed protein product, partial [marine sediment metagenome]
HHWVRLFEQLHLPETVRGEELLIKDYVALADALKT